MPSASFLLKIPASRFSVKMLLKANRLRKAGNQAWGKSACQQVTKCSVVYSPGLKIDRKETVRQIRKRKLSKSSVIQISRPGLLCGKRCETETDAKRHTERMLASPWFLVSSILIMRCWGCSELPVIKTMLWGFWKFGSLAAGVKKKGTSAFKTSSYYLLLPVLWALFFSPWEKESHLSLKILKDILRERIPEMCFAVFTE